jgi:TolB-like protein
VLHAGDAPKPEVKKPDENKISVAVLGCRASAAEVIEISHVVPALLNTDLSRNEKLDMVEREQMDKVLSEHELGQSGLVDPDQAAQVGKLLGARILILPTAFVSGTQVYLSAKVINVETGRVKSATKSGLLAKASADTLAALVADDINKILDGDIIKSAAPSDDDKLNKIVDEIKKKIGNVKKPVVTVVVPEEHLRRTVPDPAVNTQLCYLLRKLRFQVIENDSADLEKWVKDYFAGKSGKFPAEAANVDVVVYGGAFSESAGMKGNFHSARARVELSAIDVKTGEVIAIQRGVGSASDISESVAAKTALEKATTQIAQEFIGEMVTEWANPGKAPPPAKPDAAKPDAPKPDAPKADVKPDAPKPDAPKSEAKPDAPRTDDKAKPNTGGK